MKGRTLIFFLLLLTIQSATQNVNFIWAKQLGGDLTGVGNSIATDASGNVYTTGNFGGTVDFDPGTGVFNLSTGIAADIFISKLDAAGNFLWAKQIKGSGVAWNTGKDIVVDASGNVYITGWFNDTADFDPGPGIFNLGTIGGTDIFILKLDIGGNLLWAKQLKGTTSSINDAFSITLDGSGNVLITGSLYGGAVDFDPGPGVYNLSPYGIEDMYILKLDNSGNFIWAKHMGGIVNDRIVGLSIAVDGAGNIYTTGGFNGSAPDFDPGPGVFIMTSSFSVNKIFLSKLDAGGNFIWAKQMVGVVNPNLASFGASGWSIKLGSQGSIFLSGIFGGTVDFDPGPGTFLLNSNDGEGFVSKFDNSGNLVWATNTSQVPPNSFSGLWSYSIDLDATDNVYVTGWFSGTVDFDPGIAVANLTATPGFNDVYVSKFSTTGNFVWVKQMLGNAGGIGNAISVDLLGNVYTTGIFSGTVDFDPGSGVYNLSSTGNNSVFVHKMGPCPTSSSTVINATTCNNYIINNHAYDSSGTYTLLLQNTSGCDSVVILHLTVTHIATVDTATACNSYNWNGQLYNNSGVYKDTFQIANSCDSVVTLHLTINHPVNSTVNITSCKPYVWNGQTYTVSGLYTDSLITVNGCDSIVALNLVVKQPTWSNINASICPGESYEGHSSPGTYVDTLVSITGCDSIRTLHLSFNPLNPTSITASICQGESYLGYGTTGVYSDTLNGCIIRHLNLTVKSDCVPVAIPTAFSPNNDGLNDVFKPVIHGNAQLYRFVVYNRWGEVVFQTSNLLSGWNGTFNGKSQPEGTYVYTVYIMRGAGNETSYKGTVQLLR